MAKILLVDDSKTLLKYIKRMLLDGGHEVIAATSGREALEHVRTTTFDLLLTDLYMPEMDGFELVQAVRALPNGPTIVVMSTNTLACGVFRDAQALGAAASLEKPFTAEQLLNTINEVLTPSIARARPEEPVLRSA